MPMHRWATIPVAERRNPSDLLTKAIASPSKFGKFQSVLLGECEMKKEVVTQEALAVEDKNGVAHCFLIRRRGGD